MGAADVPANSYADTSQLTNATGGAPNRSVGAPPHSRLLSLDHSAPRGEKQRHRLRALADGFDAHPLVEAVDVL